MLFDSMSYLEIYLDTWVLLPADRAGGDPIYKGAISLLEEEKLKALAAWLAAEHEPQHAIPGLIVCQAQTFDEDGGVVENKPQ